MSADQQKKSPPRGGRWTVLATPGDVQRLFRYLILQVKADTIDQKKAGLMGQLGIYLLKSMQVGAESELLRRLDAIEAVLASDAFRTWRATNGYGQEGHYHPTGER